MIEGERDSQDTVAPKTVGDVGATEGFPWEAVELRQQLPKNLARILGGDTCTVVVPKNVAEKVARNHSKDVCAFANLASFFAGWEYAGRSPKGSGRFEVYSLLNGVWHTAVMKHDPAVEGHVLVTFHRIYSDKMQRRIGRGYLVKRENH